MSIPLILTLSVLPDIDLLVPMLQHGGLTHSIVLYLAIAFPAILLWREQSIPYLIAVVSHPLLGDYPTRVSCYQGVQILFPLTSTWFSGGSKSIAVTYVYFELVLFAAFLILMVATRDMAMLMKHHSSNMLLALPILTALLPVFLRFSIPVPLGLIIPHLILTVLLALPILIDFKTILMRIRRQSKALKR